SASNRIRPSIWLAPFGQLLLPLVHQRPVDGAGAEVGHVEIALEASDRAIEEGVVFAEVGAVAGEEPFHVAGANPLQRLDEGWDVAAVVSVNRPHAAVA